MKPSLCCRLLAVAACIAAFAAAPAAGQVTFPDTSTVPAAAPSAALPIAVVGTAPFSTIQVCAPVNVLIVPSNSTNYTVTGQAEQSVLNALIPAVVNGTLQLQSAGNFSTNNIVSVQVSYTVLYRRHHAACNCCMGMLSVLVKECLAPSKHNLAALHTDQRLCHQHHCQSCSCYGDI